MSCIKETYMEYSIMTTNGCNLHCSYCINSDRRRKEPAKKSDANRIIAHIRKDVKQNGYDPVVITFYGGEPLLELGLISEIMNGTADMNVMYNVFTNGTLISRNNLPVLSKMHMISISMDGDREMHEKVRGKGSFQKILDNYEAVKNELKGSVLAFVTITPKSEFYRSVTGLMDKFDNIFWFLENSGNKDNLSEFVKEYDRGLDRLLELWLSNLRKGKVLKLIPFQGLYDMLEHKHVYTGLPCGIGSNFQAIAIDGAVYSCEDSYHNRLGSIDEGVNMKNSRTEYSFDICKECDIRNICSGRCVIPHLQYDREKVEFYCNCSKLLVEKYKKALPEIKRLVSDGVVKEEELLNRLTRFTDVMP